MLPLGYVEKLLSQHVLMLSHVPLKFDGLFVLAFDASCEFVTWFFTPTWKTNTTKVTRNSAKHSTR
ncbi:hypothetical protein PF003_g36465 [Phytophthora fragariae]|nr:hypothetical protein PF003_g36465 [Phytophthora fragariae]